MKNMKDSPSIPQRVLVEQESGSEVLVSTPAWLALAKKAGKSDVPLSVLEQVYARGIVTAEPHPKNSYEQQAFHRVESFIHEGKAFELDNDLTEMCPVPDGSKHMDVIKNAIKNHKKRIRSQQVNEGWGRFVRRGGLIGAAGRAISGALSSSKGKRSTSGGGGIKKLLWNPTKRGGDSPRPKADADDDYGVAREKAARRSQASREGSVIGKYRADTSVAAPGSELEKARAAAKIAKPKLKQLPYTPGEFAKSHPPPKGFEDDPAYAHTQEARDKRGAVQKMSDYKGVTHTIVEMLARTQIQAVPRKKDTPRTELPEVGRPKDDRFGEVPTRQQEIQRKIIDEDDVAGSAEPGQIAGPAPEKEKKPRKLDIEDIGKQKPTQVVINPELDNTPNIFASTEVKGKQLDELRDTHNSTSIQYQTRGGVWITARKTSNQPSDIMMAMRTVQKAYSSNRVRAVGPLGMFLDVQPIDPRSLEVEETSEKELQKAKGRTIEAWWDNKPKALKNFKQVSKALKKKELDEGIVSDIGTALAKSGIIGKAAAKSGVIAGGIASVRQAFPSAAGVLDKYSDVTKYQPGYPAFAKAGEGDVRTNLTKSVQTLIRKGRGDYPGAQPAKDKINQTVENIVNEILTYKNSASLRGRDAVAQRDAAIAQAQAQQAQAQQQQQPPQKKKKKQQQPVQEAKDPRHTGIEVDEPKFNQSIQRVAAHTKWNADAVHTYKHADGSKTRVDQELGTKIHDKISSTPNRHKAKLVQHIHKSADNLKRVLGK